MIFLLYSTNLKYRVIFFYFSEILMFSYKTQNYYVFFLFRMKVLLVPLLISLCEAKKDKFFYCQTCSALIQESFYKVSQVGKSSSYYFYNFNYNIDAKKTINVGSSRIDPNGQMKERTKQWRLSVGVKILKNLSFSVKSSFMTSSLV